MSKQKYRKSKAMTKKLCYSLANTIWKSDKSFTHKDRFIFYYVLQVILYQVFDTIVILLIGILLNKLLITLFVISAFIFARSKYKGYHAKSILACGIFSVGMISICIIISPNIIVSALLGYSLGYMIGINRVKIGMRKIEDKLFTRR